MIGVWAVPDLFNSPHRRDSLAGQGIQLLLVLSVALIRGLGKPELVRVPGQTMETPDPRFEPAFQDSPLPSFGKDENPESQFADK